MSYCLGDRVDRGARLVRVLGRTPADAEATPGYISAGWPTHGVYEKLGRSDPLAREVFHYAPFDGWEVFDAPPADRTPQGRGVSWWLKPEPVAGIVVARRRCQTGWACADYELGGHFIQSSSFTALYVADKLGPITQLVMVPE